MFLEKHGLVIKVQSHNVEKKSYCDYFDGYYSDTMIHNYRE